MRLNRRSFLSGLAGTTAATILAPPPSFAKTTVGITPERFGAAGDGVADDLDAWTRAVAESAARSVPITPTAGRTYKLGDTLRLTKGARIAGPARSATLIAPEGGIAVTVQANTELSGLSIVNEPRHHIQHDAKAGVLKNVKLSGLNLKGGHMGLSVFGYGMNNDGLDVSDCDFDGVANPVYLEMAQNSRFNANRYKGAKGANIALRMGNGNIFQNQTIEGGITGIVFLSLFKNSKFRSGTFENNIITGNTLRDVKEEFISFDANLGRENVADGNARETAPIRATHDDDPEFFVVELAGDWAGAQGFYAHAYACVMTGAAVGAVVRVDEADGGTLYFRKGATMNARLFRQLRRGDVVVLGLPFLDNLVSKNTIQGPTGADKVATGVYLYNLCFHNRVEENDITLERSASDDLSRGISIRSTNGFGCAESFASREGAMCAVPSIGNEIRRNRLRNADIVLDLKLYRGGPYVSALNRVEDNEIIGGRLVIEGHERLAERNAITP